LGQTVGGFFAADRWVLGDAPHISQNGRGFGTGNKLHWRDCRQRSQKIGYCVFGYREYPSLIKGGHASYQLDVSNHRIRSTETKVNVLVALNHHGLELNMEELKQGAIVLHVTPGWQFPEHYQN